MDELPVEDEVTLPECTGCGRCCTGAPRGYVPVRGSDHARLGGDAAALTEFVGTRCFMRMIDARCVALDVSTGRALCRVYPRRPEACRALERGSPECWAELERKPAVLT